MSSFKSGGAFYRAWSMLFHGEAFRSFLGIALIGVCWFLAQGKVLAGESTCLFLDGTKQLPLLHVISDCEEMPDLKITLRHDDCIPLPKHPVTWTFQASPNMGYYFVESGKIPDSHFYAIFRSDVLNGEEGRIVFTATYLGGSQEGTITFTKRESSCAPEIRVCSARQPRPQPNQSRIALADSMPDTLGNTPAPGGSIFPNWYRGGRAAFR